jgi:glycosyltransferase involved in cell wall biosynthesis
MMRIGVVTTSYPRFAGDPAGSFVAAHVAATRALGHELDVIAAGDGPSRIPSRLFYGAGAPEELERGGALWPAAAFSARLAIAVARRARGWDAAIAHWLAPSALAALPAKRLLAIAHGGDVHALRRAHLLAPALYALRARDARLAFVSHELLDLARAAAPRLARWLDRAAIVQPMGIDVARFAAIRRAPTKTIAVISRLVPVKGVDVAILAARELDADLVIAGDGPERAALERIGGARFLGTVDPAARDRLLATAACVVIPSRVLPNGRSEGTPMIALEALAAGVPVIASAVGGLRELPGVRLVPPDDPHALAAAITSVTAASPAPEILRASVAHLDWPQVAARLLAHLA